MNKSFLLLKDGHIHYCKKSLQRELNKLHYCIKYILTPIGDLNNSYILHKVKDYMLTFTKAEITFNPVIIRKSYIVENETSHRILSPVYKELYTLEDLLQYLHSLNRMRYCNKISNSNESAEYDLTEFISFDITIYRNKDIVYEKHTSDVLGPIDILTHIEDVYNPIIKKDSYLNITHRLWSIKKSPVSESSLIGLPLNYTKSYQFFSYNMLEIMKTNIREVFCSSIIYNPATDDIDIVDMEYISESLRNSMAIRYHDIWEHSINDYLEYVVYLPTLYTNLITYAELLDFPKVSGVYKAKTSLLISLSNSFNDRSKEIISTSDNIITISSFIETIYNLSKGII